MLHDEAAPDADEGAILDVHLLPLDALLDADDSVLSNAVRRVVHHVDVPAANYAAHSTST